MTQPVPVLSGVSLLNTRRIHEGRFHLRPDPVVNNCIEFALAYSADKYGIELYAHISLSNHHHTVFHDPYGKHPEFRREFHSLVTRSLNVHRGTSEAKWSPDHKSPVIIFDLESLLSLTDYTLSNATRHGLVDEPEEWPGVLTKIDEIGGPPRLIRKPAKFYDPCGELPDTVRLQYLKPHELSHWTLEEYRSELQRRVDATCTQARKERRAEKRAVLGRIAILSQDPFGQPAQQPDVRTRNPRVACRLAVLRVTVLQWLAWFRRQHRSCRRKFEAGETTVEFPCGTYWHVLRYGVNCSATGPPGPSIAS